MTWVSFAQTGEDVLLRRALGHIPEGFWVDVGAGDPEVDSVTAHLSSLGWRGINIEPDPEACARLAAARPRDVTLCCAAGAAPGRAVLHRIAGTGLSTLDPAIAACHAAAGLAAEPVEVEVRTLAEICDAHAPPVIHVLKVDAEGHEAAVLAGADFARHRPWVVLVEATEPNRTAPTHAAWEPGLLAAGYQFVWFDGLNRWYLAAEHAEALRGAFAAPPNPFDGYVRRAEVAWQQRAEAAEAWGQRDAAARGEAEGRARQEGAARAVAEAAARTERDAIARALEAAEAARRAAERQAETAAAQNAAAETRAAAAEAAAEAARRVEAMERSRSWRLTRPLRVLGNAARGHPGLALMEAGVPRARVEAWKTAWQAGRRAPEAAPPDAPPRPVAAPCAEGWPVICMDVTLSLRHGDRPAVGLVRVEHDVTRHLLAAAGLKGRATVLPVLCDASGRYRLATREERERLDAILHGHAAPDMPGGAARAAESHGGAAQWAEGIALLRRVAGADPTLRQALAEGVQARSGLPGWIARGVTGAGVIAARAAARLLDRPPRQEPVAAAAPVPEAEPLPEGAVLVSAGNQWDYLDYAWLAQEVQAGRLAVVTVLYDVIAADLPWVTPAPPDLYHRHWVEIGHLSRRLVAISEHTARQYRALIGEPNLIEVPIEACPLPLSFVERAASLVPQPVPSLEGRRFVLYVSTIETRKDHQLLLHAWDRLLRELPPEAVPQLVFVGAWGWGTEATRLMVERNWRTAQHVQVLTGVPDEALLWLYRNATLAVFPALAEGFGLGAAEAVALGTPCLVSDCPALTEATQGLMPALDPLDLPGWVAALRRLFTDAAELAALRARTAAFRPLPEGAFREAVARAALAVAEGR